MAAPGRAWLAFGFSPEEAAGEPGPGPGPWRLEAGPEGISRVWPAWSYVVVETGAGLELRSAGQRRRLPGWAEALPSETHLVLRGAAGTRAWRRAAALSGALRGEPAWSRDEPAGSGDEPARSRDLPAGSREEPAGSGEEPAGSRGEPSGSRDPPAGSRGEPAGSREEPAWSRGEPAGSRGEPSGSRDPPAGSRGEPAWSWDPPAGSRDPPAGSRDLPAGSRDPPAGSRDPPAWSRDLPAGSRDPLAGSRDPPAWSRDPSPGSRDPPAGSRDPPAGSRDPPAEPRQPLPLLPGGFATPRPPFFTALPAGLRLRRLALGTEHALALGAGGEVFSWGGGRHGQLGHGLLESELQPRLLEALAGLPMRAVAAGGWHSASVSEAGDLYVWGWNESGQLALPCKALAAERAQAEDAGTGSPKLTPCREELPAQDAAFISIQAFPALLDLPQDLEVSAVSCGSRHTAAVTRGGELYTWGWGKYGQLGHGNNISSDQARRVEQLVAEGLRVEEVVCGPWTTYVRVQEL